MKLLGLLICTFLLQVPVLSAQAPMTVSPLAVVTFHLEWPSASPSAYTIQLQSDGVGLYWQGSPSFNAEEAVGTRKIAVSQESVRKVMMAQAAIQSGSCETHLKHLAQTGRKTLVFNAGVNPLRCEFNYSDDERLNAAVALFEAIAETIDYGDKLEHTHRFDRLGLDAELDFLTSEAKEGRAIELQNIGATLRSIVDDERVIDRARRKAARLLQDAAPPAPETPR